MKGLLHWRQAGIIEWISWPFNQFEAAPRFGWAYVHTQYPRSDLKTLPVITDASRVTPEGFRRCNKVA
jgi:hypothetical protein